MRRAILVPYGAGRNGSGWQTYCRNRMQSPSKILTLGGELEGHSEGQSGA